MTITSHKNQADMKIGEKEKNYSFANGKDYEIPGHYTKSGNPVTYMQR